MEVSTIDKRELDKAFGKLRKTKKSIRKLKIFSYKKKKKIFEIL